MIAAAVSVVDARIISSNSGSTSELPACTTSAAHERRCLTPRDHEWLQEPDGNKPADQGFVVIRGWAHPSLTMPQPFRRLLSRSYRLLPGQKLRVLSIDGNLG